MTKRFTFTWLSLGLGLTVNLLLFSILAGVLSHRQPPPQLSCHFTIQQFVPSPDLLAQSFAPDRSDSMHSSGLTVSHP